MRSILYKTGFILILYLSAMILVSGLSFLFSTESPGEHQSEAQTIIVETKQEETVSSEESTEPVKTNPSDSQPFDFSVNIIAEVDESPNKPIILSKSIPTTEPPDIHGTLFTELEKRKRLVVYIPMRRLFKLKQDKPY